MTLRSAVGPESDPLFLVDAHTHTSGPDHDGPPGDVVACLDACGVQKAFVFAPLLQPQGLELTEEHLPEITVHNDYVADFCSHAPERLLGFAVLNPNPGIAGGDRNKATELMIQEARRCYHELGLRGFKLVADRWDAEQEEVLPLWQEMANLGTYAVFHTGIFMDERSSTYCRPAYYEGLHRVQHFTGQLAHLGWPWVDEMVGMLMMEGEHPDEGGDDQFPLVADISFGAPPDWRIETLRKALDMLGPQRLVYGGDCFWPQEPEQYFENYLLPHLAAFESAADLSKNAPEQGPERAKARRQVFRDNALRHWERATRGVPQRPRRAQRALKVTKSRSGCC